jgi:ribonuclease BN (tRNA processing enzyme)
LHVNGVDAPLLRQLGCGCGRCLAPGRKANTSVSLLARNGKQIERHLLVDAGLGVIDSLIDSGLMNTQPPPLDGIVLTHWHPDHLAELFRLLPARALDRKRRGLPAERIPLYARQATIDWLAREQGYLLATYLEPHPLDNGEAPGAILSPLPVAWPGATITPVSVGHYTADRGADDQEIAFACAAYIIETGRTKTVLLWDIDSENEWLANPSTPGQSATVDLLSDADHLFIDTTFWAHPRRPTTHPSFENVRRYAATLRPHETLLMHLSGHPDGPNNPGWGWTDAQWTAAARAQWAADGLPGDVRVPAIGERFDL